MASASGDMATWSRSQQRVLDCCGPRLDALEPGSYVAVVTMLGSLCPVTLGHVQGFLEARRLLLRESDHPVPLRLEHFTECLGFISLNGDGHVESKVRSMGHDSLDFDERKLLVELAIEDYEWMGCERWEGATVEILMSRWPELEFVHFCMNGADDVVRYRKYQWSGPQSRFITMGRSGFTEEVQKGMAQARVDPDDGFFILGPELPDISSTAVRVALQESDMDALDGLVHPRVAGWCIEKGYCQ